MMRLAFLFSVATVLTAPAAVTGFCPVPDSSTLRTAAQTAPSLPLFLQSQADHDENDDSTNPAMKAISSRIVDYDISRRAALVIAAAAAVGTGSAVPAAHAVSRSAIVAGLEAEFIGQVNSKGAPEKHTPKVEVSGSKVQVVVPHVMDPEKPHYIQYIWLKDEATNKVVASKAFQATDASPPTLTASSVKKGSTLKPFLFCNLHGLWQGESVTV